MENAVIIPNRLRTTANKYAHYSYIIEYFCKVCIKRNVIPTAIRIKKKPSMSLSSEEFFPY